MNRLPSHQRFLAAAGAVAILGCAVFLSAGGPEPPLADPAPPPSILRARAADAQTTGRAWAMYGGTVHRNMINTVERDLPAEWDIKTKKNIKWIAELGSQSYGNPVVSGGKIFLGTNNGSLRNPRDARKATRPGAKPIPEDKGNILCFRETDGKFLWQAVHDKLPSGQVNDWPEQGVCSSPFIEGDRLYYVSNRCELVCADTEGFANGNQGAQDEKYKDPSDADFIWRLDMMEELGVFPHNLAVCSPIVVGDLVFVVTGNGHDESHENIPSPKAPSFIAVDKKTGKVVWENAAPGEKILHGQWSNPAYAVIKGRPQVIFAGGDGWVRAFEPGTGKEIWKFDCNPKAAVYKLGGRGTRNYIIATPVVYDDKVFIASGQDPEHGEGIGHLWCIDAGKTGDLSAVNDNLDPKAPENKDSGLVWHYGGRDEKGALVYCRTISTCAIKDDILYAADLRGFLHCLDAKTGKKYWEHDTVSQIWGSPYVVDGKVYLGVDEGDVYVFKEGKEKKLLVKNNVDNPVLSTPVAVNGVLYVMTRSHLYAIAGK